MKICARLPNELQNVMGWIFFFFYHPMLAADCPKALNNLAKATWSWNAFFCLHACSQDRFIRKILLQSLFKKPFFFSRSSQKNYVALHLMLNEHISLSCDDYIIYISYRCVRCRACQKCTSVEITTIASVNSHLATLQPFSALLTSRNISFT